MIFEKKREAFLNYAFYDHFFKIKILFSTSITSFSLLNFDIIFNLIQTEHSTSSNLKRKMSNLNSPQKSSYKEIYESQNDCSVSGISIKINCENHLTASSTNSTNLNLNDMIQLPSSSASSSFDSQTTNKLFNKQPQAANLINMLDDDIIELPEVEYPIVEPVIIRGILKIMKNI